MNSAAAVRQLYLQYYADADAAVKKCGPADGLFGLGKKAADDPCHTAFFEALEKALAQFRQEEPDSGAVRALLSFIYEAPDTHREPVSAYWMLIAAHGLTAGLIGSLCREDAAALYDDYRSRYRRWERLPVQKDILQMLKQAAQKD